MAVAPVTALVVDDNTEVREATGLMLEGLGYKVQTACDAADALQILERATFGFVLSDISMPGEMDGIRLGRRLRATYPRLPVILMTGYSEFFDEAEREFAVLHKPFSISDLKAAILSEMN